MKKQLLTICLLLSYSVMAQKVDLDRFYFDVKYQSLPKEYVPFEKRTYGIHVKTGGPVSNYLSETAIYDKINLIGWKRVETGEPTVGIDVTLEDFVYRGSEPKTETITDKDDKGKVIGTRTYYWVEAKYATRGFAKITEPITASKEEPKKEEVKPVNKFLVNAVINKPAAVTEDGQSISFNNEILYASEKKSNTTGVTEFNNNKDAIYNQKLRDFVDGVIYSVSNRINVRYGFPGIATKEILWILDAKNDEGKTQTEAIEAVKEIFKGMKADESTDVLATNLQPLIDYFESLKTKYVTDDKPGRKMRHSAYYNLAKIYLFLDQPDKTIKECEALITNDYDPKDGKKMIEEAIRLKELFAKTGFANRHNIPLK